MIKIHILFQLFSCIVVCKQKKRKLPSFPKIKVVLLKNGGGKKRWETLPYINENKFHNKILIANTRVLTKSRIKHNPSVPAKERIFMYSYYILILGRSLSFKVWENRSTNKIILPIRRRVPRICGTKRSLYKSFFTRYFDHSPPPPPRSKSQR